MQIKKRLITIEQIPILIYLVKWLIPKYYRRHFSGFCFGIFFSLFRLGHKLARKPSLDYCFFAHWWLNCGLNLSLFGQRCCQRKQPITRRISQPKGHYSLQNGSVGSVWNACDAFFWRFGRA